MQTSAKEVKARWWYLTEVRVLREPYTCNAHTERTDAVSLVLRTEVESEGFAGAY
jgi:hypothetical protein